MTNAARVRLALVGRVALALVGLVAGSCGGASTTSSAAEHQRRSDEIIALDRDVARWRHELGLDPQPQSRWFIVNPKAERARPWSAAPAAAQRSPECGSVCDLARYICDAKDQICRISSEMGDDLWAKNKCEKAQASCREAKKSCTDCR